MKTLSKIYLVILLPFLFLSFSAINFAQVNTKLLESKVEKTIGGYYPDHFDISASNEGVITIKGTTNTLFDKLKIGELISNVEGVRSINNKIEVQTEPTPDNIIKYNIENEMELNNVILEPKNIIVDVSNGVVNLSGTVSYFREKLMAQSIASWQDGVVDITSSIKVLPSSKAKNDDNLKQLIADILQKHFSLENNLNYAVSNGVVSIGGSVSSLYAKDHIQEEIQKLLGVKDVVNTLTVQAL